MCENHHPFQHSPEMMVLYLKNNVVVPSIKPGFMYGVNEARFDLTALMQTVKILCVNGIFQSYGYSTSIDCHMRVYMQIYIMYIYIFIHIYIYIFTVNVYIFIFIDVCVCYTYEYIVGIL
jgi:hypothetical protein